MIGRQQVEQRALHLSAGLPGAFLLELAAQQALELVERFETERLGEIIIGSACARDFDGLDGDVESGGLALEVFGRIVIREGHGDGLFIARLGADQLFFEARNETACAQFQRGIAGGAAIERHAIDLADEIDDQLIAVFRFLALLGIDESLGARGQLGQLLIDFGLGHRNHQLFELEPIERRRGDGRQHFDADGQLGVLTLFIAFAQRDLRLHCGTQLVVADHLVDRIADRGVERFLVKLGAVHLLDQIGRNLARAEAGHPHLRGHLGHFAIDQRGNIASLDLDGVPAAQTFVGGLDNLHDKRSLLENLHPLHRMGRAELVRAKGLEPPHLAILVPKTSASTNSATPAARRSSLDRPARANRFSDQAVALSGATAKGQALALRFSASQAPLPDFRSSRL